MRLRTQAVQSFVRWRDFGGYCVGVGGAVRTCETTCTLTAPRVVGNSSFVYFRAVLKNSMMGRSYASSCSPVAASRPPPVIGRSFFVSTLPPKQCANSKVEARHGSLEMPVSSSTFSLRVAPANSHVDVFWNLPAPYTFIPHRASQ